jgi:hypothetical protein
MSKIIFEEIGLGLIKLLEQGKDFEFEIISCHDGRTIGYTLCKGVKKFKLENPYVDSLVGAFIIVIKLDEIILPEGGKNYNLVMESGGVWIEITCLDVEVIYTEKRYPPILGYPRETPEIIPPGRHPN